MAQLAKGIAAKPDYLSSSPEAHVVGRENQLPQVETLTPTCVSWRLPPPNKCLKMYSAINLIKGECGYFTEDSGNILLKAVEEDV